MSEAAKDLIQKIKRDQIRAGEMAVMQNLADLGMGDRGMTEAEHALAALNAIQNEVVPINGHPDPGGISDCFETVREFILARR